MRKFRGLILVAALILVASLSLASAIAAQDDETVTCPADLVLNLYIAERYFDFAAVRDMAMASATDTSAMVDLETIEKGAFAPWFDALASAMDSNMMMSNPIMTEDMMAAMSGMMMMDDAAMMEQMATMAGMDATDMDMSTMMSSMEGEDESCTQLRTELTRFFAVLAFTDMQMGMGMMDMTGTDTTGTDTTGSDTTVSVEATPSVEATEEASATLVTFTAPLSGPQEVPGPGDADATGNAVVTVDSATNEICWDITITGGTTLPADAAHIHVGAAGEAGDVVVPLSAPDANGLASDCTTAEAAVVTAILANPLGYYVNIHTSDFPAGALRGQLIGGA